MRRALIVGIDNYPETPLGGCVNDAKDIETVLATHGDGSPNFQALLMTAPSEEVTKPKLREVIEKLFATDCETALFYFSGHGFVRSADGYIVTMDSESYDEGISMTEILRQANNSPVKNKVIILDCCYSGNMGTPNIEESSLAQLSEGLTVLTASRGSEVAMEQGGGGVFTQLVVDALQGARLIFVDTSHRDLSTHMSIRLSVRGTSARSSRRTSHSSRHCARYGLRFHWKHCESSSITSQARRMNMRLTGATRTRRQGTIQRR